MTKQTNLTELVKQFRKNIEPALVSSSAGKYALVDSNGLVELFMSSGDAEIFALAQDMEVGKFCIQEVGADIRSFGYMGITLE